MSEAISKLLAVSVVVTGAVSLVVFAIPDLITIGLFLFILPGVILGLAPTIFLYLSTFSIAWFCLNHRGIPVGIAAGLAAAAGVGYGLPSLLNLQSEASVMQARAKEATPAGKLDVPHVIGLRRSRHNFDSCDAMCQMLLYGSS